MTEKKKKIGLIPRLIIAIALGILVGQYCPAVVTKIAITISGLFGKFLNFIIPLMIIAFVSKGIADLSEGAGKLLGATVALAYASTLIAGSLSYTMARNIFPSFIKPELAEQVQKAVDKCPT
ncbi:MAG: cation:dicarboxylase symporter family transporter, partial [Peptoniphilus harei]|nr:cation:dicarboxylase symporter family transporter [Peptoniphilus harei]